MVARMPLLLPANDVFPEHEINIWMGFAAELLPGDLSARALVSVPCNGIPELVYEKICQGCGFSWEGEVNRCQ